MIHPIKHFITITRHRHKVMLYCFKCGLIKQGLLHDLSKYGFTEFHLGAKYYAGTYSPNENERRKNGFSYAWLHHKGRNKHHVEYWVDIDKTINEYAPVLMPKKYIAESICDRIAASKIYRGKEFKREDVLNYFMKEGPKLPMHEKVRELFIFLLNYYVENGEKSLFKYMKKNLRSSW